MFFCSLDYSTGVYCHLFYLNCLLAGCCQSVCSNSNKQYDQQVRIAKEVLHSRQVDPELHTLVKGLMIESYIEPGNQKIGCDHIYGKSITDPCLGWEESERLLYTIAEMC